MQPLTGRPLSPAANQRGVDQLDPALAQQQQQPARFPLPPKLTSRGAPKLLPAELIATPANSTCSTFAVVKLAETSTTSGNSGANYWGPRPKLLERRQVPCRNWTHQAYRPSSLSVLKSSRLVSAAKVGRLGKRPIPDLSICQSAIPPAKPPTASRAQVPFFV